MEQPSKTPWLALALAGAGHAAFFGGLLLVKTGDPAAPESEVVFTLEDAGEPGGDAGGKAPGAASPAVVSSPPATAPAAEPQAPIAPVPPTPATPPPAPPAPEVTPPPPVTQVVKPLVTGAPTDPVPPPVRTATTASRATAAPRVVAATGAGGAPGPAAGTGAGKGVGKGVGAGTGTERGEAPRYRRRVSPDYPSRARRLGLEGEVLLRIHISPQGDATRVEVRKSSGHRLLDEAAREAALDSEYEPARRDGRPVPAVAEAPVTFRLKP